MSQMSDSEYVSLIIHYNNIGKDEKRNDLKGRGYNKKMLAQMQDIASDSTTQQRSLNVKYSSAVDVRHPDFFYLHNLYRQFSKNGVMPFNGCMTDQPSKIMECFDIFSSLESESEQKRMNAMKGKGQRGRR